VIEPRRAILSAEVADHYDDLDGFYREVWGEHVHHGLWRTGRETTEEAVRGLVSHVAGSLAIDASTRVVDVSSGYGATARQLALDAGASVTAVTLSPAQHAHALRVGDCAGKVSYRLGDWTTSTLQEGAFERVIAIESTEHMQDKLLAFQQMHRVLVPGGRVGICAWIAADRPAPWMIERLLEPICREGRLPGMGTEGDYRALLERSGFQVEGVQDLSVAVRDTWSHSVRRVATRLARDGRYRRYLLSGTSRNREFALTLVRILVAYRVGAMRYLFFVARR
jgi:tocopherol O-methyltransferase